MILQLGKLGIIIYMGCIFNSNILLRRWRFVLVGLYGEV